MTVLQAVAIVALWRTRRFDTVSIAELLHVRESDVLHLLAVVRDHEVGVDQVVVQVIQGDVR